jgi:serine/threonine-protein kinase
MLAAEKAQFGAHGGIAIMLEPGHVVDRYVLVRLLGSGAQGTVWLVRHQQLGSDHAMKVVPARGRAAERMRIEGQSQAAVRSCPYVVQVTDAVPLDNLRCLIMDYVPGGSLEDRVAAGPLPLDETDRFVTHILEGLAAVHAAGVVHRDVKPANVLIDNRSSPPVARLVDFGVARILDSDDPRLTAHNLPMGTPAFMAPEQVTNAAGVDARADLWAAGVVALACLTGRSPFLAGSLAETFDNVRAGRPPPVPDNTPERMRSAIEAALVVDPDRRVATAAQMLAIWKGPTRAAQTLPEDWALAAPRPPATRRRATIAALATVGLVLTAAVVWSVARVEGEPTLSPPDLPEVVVVVPPPDPAEPALPAEPAPAPAPLPVVPAPTKPAPEPPSDERARVPLRIDARPPSVVRVDRETQPGTTPLTVDHAIGPAEVEWMLPLQQKVLHVDVPEGGTSVCWDFESSAPCAP